ncbi:hypothetical protein D3C81_1228140 [compost metagenome]
MSNQLDEVQAHETFFFILRIVLDFCFQVFFALEGIKRQRVQTPEPQVYEVVVGFDEWHWVEWQAERLTGCSQDHVDRQLFQIADADQHSGLEISHQQVLHDRLVTELQPYGDVQVRQVSDERSVLQSTVVKADVELYVFGEFAFKVDDRNRCNGLNDHSPVRLFDHHRRLFRQVVDGWICRHARSSPHWVTATGVNMTVGMAIHGELLRSSFHTKPTDILS